MAVTTLNRSEQIRTTSNTNSVAYNDGSGKLTDGSTLTWDGTTLDVGANITANSSTGAFHATSATLTNALPVTSGGTGTTTSTGTGSVVLSNSPTLVTPALGTPSTLVLTNATGTPASIGLTNGTGLPLTTGVTGTLPIANGGTNSNTALSNGFLIVSSGGQIIEANGSNYSMDNGIITNLGSPVSATDAATKAYVDAAINGLTWKAPVQAATVTVLPFSPTYSNGSSGVGATLTAGSNGVLTIDGYTVLLNDRILVQNQASAFQNGIYTVTTLGTVSVPYVLTRATDSNTPTGLEAGTATIAVQGTTNADTGFLQTTTGTIVIGTTNLVYITFTSTVTAYFAGNGLDLTSRTFSISTDDTLHAFAGGSTPSLTLNLSGRTAGGIVYDTDDSTGLHESTHLTWTNSSTLMAITGSASTEPEIDLHDNNSLGVTLSAFTDANVFQINVFSADGSTLYGQVGLGTDGSGSSLSAFQSSPVTIITGSNQWTFSSSGNLTLANDLIVPSVAHTVYTDGSSNTVSLQAPTTITSSYTLKWPTSQSTGSQVLTDDGAGNLSWTTVSTGTFVWNETPSGTINGSNTTFTLAHSPAASGNNLLLFLNGLLQKAGVSNDYTISGGTITYNTAPQTGDVLLATYQY